MGSERVLSFQVLQTNAVFHNVSKGEFAKRDALLAAFNTLDEDKVCRIILEKGIDASSSCFSSLSVHALEVKDRVLKASSRLLSPCPLSVCSAYTASEKCARLPSGRAPWG